MWAINLGHHAPTLTILQLSTPSPSEELLLFGFCLNKTSFCLDALASIDVSLIVAALPEAGVPLSPASPTSKFASSTLLECWPPFSFEKKNETISSTKVITLTFYPNSSMGIPFVSLSSNQATWLLDPSHRLSVILLLSLTFKSLFEKRQRKVHLIQS